MMCSVSLRRPGFFGRPARAQSLADSPPFQPRVVKPRISQDDAAALQRCGDHVGGEAGDLDRLAAHRAGIVDEDRHDGVAELQFLFLLVGAGEAGIDDDAVEPRGVDQALVEVERPVARLPGQQLALQLGDQAAEIAAELGAPLFEPGALLAQRRDVDEVDRSHHQVMRGRTGGVGRRGRRLGLGEQPIQRAGALVEEKRARRARRRRPASSSLQALGAEAFLGAGCRAVWRSAGSGAPCRRAEPSSSIRPSISARDSGA